MIRTEEVENIGYGWVHSQDYTGQPAFLYVKGGRRIEVGMTDDVRTLRDGRQVTGYSNPYVTLTLTYANWGAMMDVTEREAVKLLKGGGESALKGYATDFAAGEASAALKAVAQEVQGGLTVAAELLGPPASDNLTAAFLRGGAGAVLATACAKSLPHPATAAAPRPSVGHCTRCQRTGRVGPYACPYCGGNP